MKYIFLLLIFFQSCVLLLSSPEKRSNFCKSYQKASLENLKNRDSFTNTRLYFQNFDLFNIVPQPVYGKYLSYGYQISWQDSFYLYHYQFCKEYCTPCLMYDLPHTDIFELEQPVWKFYKINDSSYFSTRFSVGLKGFEGETGVYLRDSFLHQPQQIIWKQNWKSWVDSSKTYEQDKNLGIFYRKMEIDSVPTHLFWLAVSNSYYQYSTVDYYLDVFAKKKLPVIQYIPAFSMDSLIRSFQK